MRLNRVLLFVKDLPRMASFYGELLGVKPVATTQSETWVEFETRCATIALHVIPASIASTIEVRTPPEPRDDTPIKLMFEVADLKTECQRLEVLGATLIRRPWAAVDAIDPEENIIQIYSTSPRTG